MSSRQRRCVTPRRSKKRSSATCSKLSSRFLSWRSERDEKKQETNADWDRDKLEEVLRQKEGKRPQTTTKIVCRYFLDAIEKECYGWFWQCPNGPECVCWLVLTDSCKYRHALPEGYVYKSRAEREAEAALREKDRAQDKNMMRLENIEMLVASRGVGHA